MLKHRRAESHQRFCCFRQEDHRNTLLPWIGLFLIHALILLPFIQAKPAQALPSGFQEYLVLGDEYQIYRMFKALPDSGVFTDFEMRSIVSLVATADSQQIFYDHWEDGYEPDIFNPIQSTTQIFGDGNLSNGNSGEGNDQLNKGSVLSLKSNVQGASGITGTIDVSLSRNPAEIRYDSRDRIITVGGPANLVHSVWPTDNSFIGGAWEIYSFQALENGNQYTIPIGQDSYSDNGGDTGPFGDFKFIWLELQATKDNTTITLNNRADPPLNIMLNRGDTYSSLGYINDTVAPELMIREGTVINANHPVQAGLVTAGDEKWQTRFYALIPDVVWGTDYIAPVASTSEATNKSQIYMFNPNDFPISVNASDQLGSGIILIPANSARAYSQAPPNGMGRFVPENSGVRLTSDKIFWALGSYGFSEKNYDWGYSLIPNHFLTSDYYISWAPGSEDPIPTENGSPVHVTPRDDNTTFYVDYSPIDGIVDRTFTLDALERGLILDPDNDNTGMHIWTENKPFLPVWGETEPFADKALPYLDLGTTNLPLYHGWLEPTISVDKTATTQTLPTNGGEVTFQLKVESYSTAPLLGVTVTDTLPSQWSYITNSTTITFPDSSTTNLEPTIDSQTLTWNLNQTLEANEDLWVTFKAQLTLPDGLADSIYDDLENGDYTGGSGWLDHWIETDSGGSSATNGLVTNSSSGSPHGGTQHLQILGNHTIKRSADLTNFSQPTLSFWRKTESLEADDFFVLEINNGLTWTGVMTFANGDNEGVYIGEKIDISSYQSANTTFRFLGNSANGTDDIFYIDDVQITDGLAVNENIGIATGQFGGLTFTADDNEYVYVSHLSVELSVNKDAAPVGEDLVYTIDYRNSSNSVTATNVLVRLPIPANTTFKEISSGGSYNSSTGIVTWGPLTLPPLAIGTATLTVTINNVSNGSIINNNGTIDADQTIEVSSNPVDTTVLAPDLSLTKSGPTTAGAGDTITYTISYINNGDAGATGVIISDTIPVSATYVAGSLALNTGSGWVTLSDAVDSDTGAFIDPTMTLRPGITSGTVTAGESGQIRLAVTINPNVSRGATIGNLAAIDSDQTIPESSNLSSTTIGPLLIVKQSDKAHVTPGETVAFTITYRNDSHFNLTDVTTVDTIPENTTLISGTVLGDGVDTVEYSTDYGRSWSSAIIEP
ncbi:MAG: hypothetical protein AAF485_15485, partial [Chloroflexota bacterium]